jgi:hypothetical protein
VIESVTSGVALPTFRLPNINYRSYTRVYHDFLA